MPCQRKSTANWLRRRERVSQLSHSMRCSQDASTKILLKPPNPPSVLLPPFSHHPSRRRPHACTTHPPSTARQRARTYTRLCPPLHEAKANEANLMVSLGWCLLGRTSQNAGGLCGIRVAAASAELQNRPPSVRERIGQAGLTWRVHWRAGSRFTTHCSISLWQQSKRGEMTPHLLMRPISSITWKASCTEPESHARN